MYMIVYDNGEKARGFKTYQEAVDDCREDYGPRCVIGHDGDLSLGGDRTYVWPDKKSSINDCGQNAVATIFRASNVIRSV
jgi:hypothetical protein